MITDLFLIKSNIKKVYQIINLKISISPNLWKIFMARFQKHKKNHKAIFSAMVLLCILKKKVTIRQEPSYLTQSQMY